MRGTGKVGLCFDEIGLSVDKLSLSVAVITFLDKPTLSKHNPLYRSRAFSCRFDDVEHCDKPTLLTYNVFLFPINLYY